MLESLLKFLKKKALITRAIFLDRIYMVFSTNDLGALAGFVSIKWPKKEKKLVNQIPF